MRQFSKIYKIFPVETTFHGSPPGGWRMGSVEGTTASCDFLAPGARSFSGRSMTHDNPDLRGRISAKLELCILGATAGVWVPSDGAIGCGE